MGEVVIECEGLALLVLFTGTAGCTLRDYILDTFHKGDHPPKQGQLPLLALSQALIAALYVITSLSTFTKAISANSPKASCHCWPSRCSQHCM